MCICKQGNSFARAMESLQKKTEDSTENNLGNETSHKAPVNVGTLDRETTMEKLIDAGKVAKEPEELSVRKVY